MSLFMIVERFRNGKAAPVYRRFRERGRMAPDGLTGVASGGKRMSFSLGWPVRILLGLAGLFLGGFGLGLGALLIVIFPKADAELGARIKILLFLLIFAGIALYGFDLLGRAITGRYWSSRFWNALQRRVGNRLQ